MTMDETTTLIPGHQSPEVRIINGSSNNGIEKRWRSRFESLVSIENRIMIAGFLVSLSFSYTQVSLLYAFRLMSCDEYYDHHPPFEGPESKRCSIDAIAAEQAKQFTITGMSNTLFGTMNLFMAGWTVKKFGPRAVLMVQALVPAARVLIQIFGMIAGKAVGMLIIQASQLTSLVGGPAGYILVTNIYVGELIEPSRRTAVFGKLQGSTMFGQGLGYLIGGMIGNAIGVRVPFQVAFVSFLVSVAYVWIALPYISPESMNDGKKSRSRSPSGFLAPLRIILPQRVRGPSGAVRKHYGVTFLCVGIFIGVLATDYAPILIQLYATAAFDFTQADNGWLMSEFAVMRSVFLILIFPRILSIGRGLWKGGSSSPEQGEQGQSTSTSSSSSDTLSSQTQTPEKGHFDLVFLRWSLVVDGAMTTIAAFATEKKHIYLAAFLLPLGSGSAPAAKGVITDMCPNSQRADALNAVTLVESIARLSTQGLFGFIFSSLATVGKSYATFFCNAAIAIVGMLVLLFSHFPAQDDTLIDHEEDGETTALVAPE